MQNRCNVSPRKLLQVLTSEKTLGIVPIFIKKEVLGGSKAICIYICVYINIYIYICTYMYIYICIYIYVYIYIYNPVHVHFSPVFCLPTKNPTFFRLHSEKSPGSPPRGSSTSWTTTRPDPATTLRRATTRHDVPPGSGCFFRDKKHRI